MNVVRVEGQTRSAKAVLSDLAPVTFFVGASVVCRLVAVAMECLVREMADELRAPDRARLSAQRN
jgi:hypothetical protein